MIPRSANSFMIVRCRMVEPSCDLTSSPTTGILRSVNSAAHFSFETINTGMQLSRLTPRLEAGARVTLDRLLAAHRQIAEHHLGAALAQAPLDIDRLLLRRQEGATRADMRHVRRDAVMDLAHVDGDAVLGQVAPDGDGIVGQREAGLLERPADLARIDIERAGDFDIARACSRRDRNASGRSDCAAPGPGHAGRTRYPGAGRMRSCPLRRLLLESSPCSLFSIHRPSSTNRAQVRPHGPPLKDKWN